MSTFTDLLPATKSESQAAIDWTPADQPGAGLLLIKTKRSYCEYRVSELQTQWDGRAFRLDKIALASSTDPDENAYHVFVCKNLVTDCVSAAGTSSTVAIVSTSPRFSRSLQTTGCEPIPRAGRLSPGPSFHPNRNTHMACSTAPLDIDEALYALLAESEFNREMVRLVVLLRRVRERLLAFTDMDPALEMVDGLAARGVGRATAAARVMEYLTGYVDPEAARNAAQSLAWTVSVAADVLESVTF